ncbi:hypothetical protein [Chryseobacterium sp.]|uniref:hypothetical protein n=1 Tax=Chryseobacterium sp. TaxID=1871047 RepID=UPI0025C53732|nr:hypothetical protein [Chryseobacterium sp.]
MKIKYHQLLFLYAYLRLIDLSLDRSRWNSWAEFQDYFKNIIAPSLVAEYLINSFHLPTACLKHFNFIPKEKSIFNRLKPIFFQKFYLKENEVLYCCRLLCKIDKILNSDTKIYHVGIEKLRIDVASYYSDILGKIISGKDLNKLMKIEHFWQAEKIDISRLEDFVPDDFSIFLQAMQDAKKIEK